MRLAGKERLSRKMCYSGKTGGGLVVNESWYLPSELYGGVVGLGSDDYCGHAKGNIPRVKVGARPVVVGNERFQGHMNVSCDANVAVGHG